jgi:hypothetical protein
MKKRVALSALCLVLTLTAAFFVSSYAANETKKPDCYVGVSFCGNKTAEAKLLIDRIKGYTNLLVLQSGPISENETATNEICDYAVDAGLSFIMFFGDLTPQLLPKEHIWRISWLNYAKERWGARFLGVYYYDEPGGIQIDYNWDEYDFFPLAYNFTSRNYDVAERYYRWGMSNDPGVIGLQFSSIDIFTSDYALYWFDYMVGYNVVFAQAGWNHSLNQDIALIRGAAKMQNRNWGTIVTWKYRNPPYLDDGNAIFEQMRTSYICGAEYVVVFNYPTLDGNCYGVMTDEHFQALEDFWNDVVMNPDVHHGSIEAEAALVLPENYGWGMRNPEDRIWGFWGPDEKSPQIWQLSRSLLEQYGYGLDIVYEDPDFPVEGTYSQIYYWNQSS